MLPDSTLQDITHTIQLAVAPVFLLSSLGTMIGVLTTRLSRVVDRARLLERRAPPLSNQDRVADEAELCRLSERARLVHYAITSATTSALLVCVLIGTAFVGYLFGMKIGVPVAILFILALAAFMLALVFFLREVLGAIGTFQFKLPAPEAGDRADVGDAPLATTRADRRPTEAVERPG